jgi:arylsulfate sulfotransferase
VTCSNHRNNRTPLTHVTVCGWPAEWNFTPDFFRCSLHRIIVIAVIAVFCTYPLACGSAKDPSSSNSPQSFLSPTENPLVAEYFVSSPLGGQVRVEFGLDTSYNRQTAWYDFSPGENGISILVAGMKPSTPYHMRAEVRSDGNFWFDADHVFVTGPLPSTNFPSLVVTRPAESANSIENAGVELINLTEPVSNLMEAVVADRDGNFIWFYDVGADQANVPYPIRFLPNGHVLINIQSGATGTTALREIDLAGRIIRQLDASALQQTLQSLGYSVKALGFHHDFLPLINGHLIVLANSVQDFTDLAGYPGITHVTGDLLIELDANWNPVWFWSSFDHLDPNRHLMGLPDWTHSNAVGYTPDDGNLLLSVRNQSWILKIDYRDGAGSGDVLWRLGEAGDFTLTSADPNDWFYAQHFPSLISTDGSAMTMAIFDNGNLRILDDNGTTCGPAPAPACYSRATIFQIDQSARTATLVWQNRPGPYSFWGGSINQLLNTDVEFDMSAPFPQVPASRVLELTQTDSPKIVWQMDIQNGHAYRAYRIPSLYPSVSWK